MKISFYSDFVSGSNFYSPIWYFSGHIVYMYGQIVGIAVQALNNYVARMPFYFNNDVSRNFLSHC